MPSCLPEFHRKNPHAEAWAQRRAAEAVTRVNKATRAGIRRVIAQAQAEGLTTRAQAALIRDLVGLTPRDARAVDRLRRQMVARGVSEAAIERRTARYADQLLRRRALTIARTETSRAAAEGQRELWRQAETKGLLTGEELREWIVTPDDRLCPECAPMDGQQVGKDEQFVTGLGNEVSSPPAHPNCRCTWALAEPAAAKTEQRAARDGWHPTEAGSWSNLTPEQRERFHAQFDGAAR